MNRRLPAPFSSLGRAVIPAALRPRARQVAERRGWVEPRTTQDDDPFIYPFAEIVRRESTPYPQYLWGTMCAAGLATALGEPRITAIEFGVAGGNGLVELERLAAWVESRSGIAIDVVGFDSGVGLPPPEDYRDVPNLWTAGDYSMDPDLLHARLDRAQLRLGPVAETVREFVEAGPAPIGFVSFDLDLYSSTRDSFAVFAGRAALLLPRVVCYFDDIFGATHSDFTGERLAISDFNRAHELRKISQLYGLRYVLDHDRWWVHSMYMLHCFDHSRYNEPGEFASAMVRELPLRDG